MNFDVSECLKAKFKKYCQLHLQNCFHWSQIVTLSYSCCIHTLPFARKEAYSDIVIGPMYIRL